jgi:hypothetical protein
MKLKSLLVLFILIVSIATPFKLQISTGQNSKVAFIFTLNVCHASDASLSVNTDSPSMYECPCKPPLPQFDGIYEKSEPSMVPILMVFHKERPPEV